MPANTTCPGTMCTEAVGPAVVCLSFTCCAVLYICLLQTCCNIVLPVRQGERGPIGPAAVGPRGIPGIPGERGEPVNVILTLLVVFLTAHFDKRP